jgi:serine/threonine protein kinase
MRHFSSDSLYREAAGVETVATFIQTLSAHKMTSTASGRSSQAIDLSSASVIPQTPSSTNHNLVSILGIAQRLNIDQLPISWQEPLGYLHDSEHGAKGGQANISQSLVDVIVSFAFKRFKSLQRNPVAVQAVWQAIVNEMTVLGHEYLQNHPYIVRLQGICWELSKDDHVWPVLVFQKTELGDLSSFAKSGALESLSLEKRLKICMQMGIAMSDMHHNSKTYPDI